MASLGSFIRSAARATYSACRRATRATVSAYRRLPVRWRLGGGSAALTFIILAVFAVGVGVLTDRQKNQEFNLEVSAQADHLVNNLKPVLSPISGKHRGYYLNCTNNIPDLSFDAQTQNAQIRVMDLGGNVLCTQSSDQPPTEAQLTAHPTFRIPTSQQVSGSSSTFSEGGYRVAAREISWKGPQPKAKDGTPVKHAHRQTEDGYLIYAEPLTAVSNPISEIRVWLTLGVLGGAVLALLAGLLVADRAMRPIAELTDVARDIERTRDPTLSIPQPVADDEVAELARTLEGMLSALDAARNESEAALARQREFVADASHELRTPLTSVLANLELLADELDGESADSAKSALMATRRMRRLVGDLLLLARADVERQKTLTTVDLADTITNAAVELGPVSDNHQLEVTPGSAPLTGLQDDLHRMVLNLIENAVHHTPPGTHIHAISKIEDGHPVLVVEDDGPGIPPDLQNRVFERFVRGGGDRGARGTGLGLAIVSAVAEAHDATVTLTSLPQLQGTRFEVRFPVFPGATSTGSGLPGPEPEVNVGQTSTTTGRTIGRLRRRS